MSGLQDTTRVTLSKFPQQGNPVDHYLLGEAIGLYYSEYAGLSFFTMRICRLKSFRCSASPYFNAVTALTFKVSSLNVLGNRRDVENHAQLRQIFGEMFASDTEWRSAEQEGSCAFSPYFDVYLLIVALLIFLKADWSH